MPPPMYEYGCMNTKCEHVSEKLRDISERDSLIKCGKCGSEAVRVTAIPSPAQFKGRGWTGKFYEKR